MTRQQALQAATEALARGAVDEAERLLLAVVAAGDDAPATMQLLLDFTQMTGRRAPAIRVLRELIAARPRKASAAHALGRMLLAAGQDTEAIDALEEAVARRPALEAAHTLLQQTRRRLGRFRAAPLVTVILPTTGAPVARAAIASVLAQRHPAVELLLVADGPDAAAGLRAHAGDLLGHPSVQPVSLPYNVGAGGFNGHRAYAAFPALARGQWVAYLDQDNRWHPDHLARCVALVAREGLDWAHSLRRIIDADGAVLCPDNCESLGRWRGWQGYHHVDTSAYFLRTDIAVKLGPVWYRRYRDGNSPDFALFQALQEQHPRHGCTGRHTLDYRIGRADSVPVAFFQRGNAAMHRKHGPRLPWLAPEPGYSAGSVTGSSTPSPGAGRGNGSRPAAVQYTQQ